MPIKQWIRDARTKANLNQEELADKLGVHKTTVSHWENGRYEPSLQQLLQIEEITGVMWRPEGSHDTRQVAVVGTARLGEDGYYEEISAALGAGDGYLAISSKDSDAYALRLRGTSMFPAIRDNWYALIEPSKGISAGEYVLVKLKDGRKMVKEFLFKRPDSIELMSVNGQERLTIDLTELDENSGLQSVGAIVPPSRYEPA